MGLFKKKTSETSAGSQETLDKFTNDMIKTANSFVINTINDFKNLNFSVKSLEVIDNMLEEASDFYEEMSEPQRQNLIASVGSYIFEVARHNFGGKYFWYDQLNQPILVTGQPEFEVSIVAFDKVKGRLENGKEDNIPFYFAGYVERVQNKQSGMIV